MNQHLTHPPAKNQSGVVLLESLIAILLIAFGVLGIIGLQATTIAAVSDARYRVEATQLADELINQIWIETTDSNVLPGYVGDADALPSTWLAKVNRLPGASSNPPQISAAANNVITLTIRWQPPKGGGHQHQVVTAINRNPVLP